MLTLPHMLYHGNVSLLSMETSWTINSNRLLFKNTSGISLLRLIAYSEGLIHGSHLDFTSLHFNSQRHSSGLCKHSHAWKSPHSHSPTHCQWQKPEAVILPTELQSLLIFSSTDRRPFVKHFLIEWLLEMLFGSAEVPTTTSIEEDKREV